MTISVTEDLNVQILDGGQTVILLNPMVVKVDRTTYVVPEGFKTDFASIPRIFWILLPPWGEYSKAAVVHDYFYATHIVSRKEADDLFLELMKYYKVSFIKRQAIYIAVRTFGWIAWDKNKKEE